MIGTAEGTHAAAFSPLDWGLLALPGVIWGSSFFFIAEGLRSFPALLIAPLRIGFGWLALGVVPAARRPVDRADWPRIALLAVVWMAFPLSMFPLAEERVSSSLTGMLNGATPLFVAVVASILLRRLPGRAQLAGLALGLAGIVLIGLPTIGEGRSSAIGVALILVALSSYGLAINILVPLQQRYGSLPVIWRAQLVAVLLTLPIGMAQVGRVELHPGPVAAVVALGVGGTGIAYALAATLAGRVGATRASVTTYLIPVVSVLLGIVVRHEEVRPVALAGCVVVLAGAWVASRAGR